MADSRSEQSRFFVVFDVDGVIVDSKAQVMAAYELAGAKMPPEAWGLPWYEWLIDVAGSREAAMEVHERKNSIYGKMPLRLLSGATVVRQLIGQGVPVALLSGASAPAIQRVVDGLDLATDLVYAESGCSTEVKRSHLVHGYNELTTIYIDDDLHRGVEVVKDTDARLIHYTSQTVDELMEDIWTR